VGVGLSGLTVVWVMHEWAARRVSIPFFSETWRPDSFYDKIKVNLDNKFHTLCLLDIKVKEQTELNLAKYCTALSHTTDASSLRVSPFDSALRCAVLCCVLWCERRGIKVYEPPRFMSIATAISQLLEVEEKRKLKRNAKRSRPAPCEFA
jgi:diphthine synthase